MSVAKKPLVIIVGAGPGTGFSVAQHFAKRYTPVVLARSSSTLEPVVSSLKKESPNALGIPTDVTSASSVSAAFSQIASAFPDVPVAAAIYNAGAFVRKPFLELSEEDFQLGVDSSVKGGFLFAQAVLPLLLESAKRRGSGVQGGIGEGEGGERGGEPTLIFTGATASIKASPNFAGFAAGKWALRALSQSLSKEFAPKGVHVAHVIVDGVIDIERTKGWLQDAGPDGKLDPQAIAEAYWHLHTQPRSCWTWELDVRPWVEKW